MCLPCELQSPHDTGQKDCNVGLLQTEGSIQFTKLLSTQCVVAVVGTVENMHDLTSNLNYWQ